MFLQDIRSKKPFTQLRFGFHIVNIYIRSLLVYVIWLDLSNFICHANQELIALSFSHFLMRKNHSYA